MQVSIVVAVADNGVIGSGGMLPWQISEDLKRFKQLTSGSAVVMGRTTFCSLPNNTLPNRSLVVLTSHVDKFNKQFGDHRHVACGDMYSAIATAKSMAIGRGSDNVFIIGGSHVYNQSFFLTDRDGSYVVNRVLLTRVGIDPHGDKYFNLNINNEREWQLKSEEKVTSSKGIELSFQEFTTKKKENV